mmetsp:Transcript_20973/g.41119  ORF Transcript_20973/g.41119 Transcript_20973/m.41119 type:complete len:257 (+) Transcript_20973:198-968(+)|eukprot:CAMPEP_0171510778 /NCGR_PEP_ID=MMETSP0959-20130129/589_1 /TAXON_ID=87120 /ORGANISM="Aurantiochytrium limacinum, Strain ATCCMYA-1381" /LENGTH=256 /DNA_ID=CAMNT_0012048253 /DNA_START=106 /DNA_END=876 /DNA_ORIENTATION=-
MDLLSLTKSLKTQAAIDKNENSSIGFLVSATGQVESGNLRGEDRLYVKYDFTYGKHWEIIQGVDKGISQIANKVEGPDTAVVWNFPIEILFKSLNAHGWPRLVVSVFKIDGLGRDIARGYGSVHIPTRPGTYTRKVRLFRPVCKSYLQQFLAWVRGLQPEFYDSRFVSKSEGREATRVESVGEVTIRLNVITRGMQSQGYEDGSKVTSFYTTSSSATSGKTNISGNENNSHSAEQTGLLASSAPTNGLGRRPQMQI